MDNLNDIIEKSKSRIENTYFRITKQEDGSFRIDQYFGPSKSNETMMREGWNCHSYLKDTLSNEYPIFNIEDFISEDGYTIRKKTDDELLKEELLEYIEYFNMNRHLAVIVKNLKSIVVDLKIDFKKANTFNALNDTIVHSINILNIANLDKANYLIKYNDAKLSLYEELEKMNIEHPVSFFNDKFRYFFMIVE